MRLSSRDPVITTDGRGAASGVTSFDGSDAGDQPAPVNARTVKVYAVALTKPSTVHVSVGAATKQVRPPGDDVTWYVEIGYDPDDAGAAHATIADPSPATAVTTRGGDAGTGVGLGTVSVPTTARPPTASTSIATVPEIPAGMTTLEMLLVLTLVYDGAATPPM
jgi:hypothetical protein